MRRGRPVVLVLVAATVCMVSTVRLFAAAGDQTEGSREGSARPQDPSAALGNAARPIVGRPEAEEADVRPFAGLKAIVLEPENFWGWDAAIFGALQERHFEVTYVKPEALDDFGFLSQHDLVASDIKRSFTPSQVANLRRFVAQGGALYGSWGGPMGASDLLREVCHVGQTRSVRITGMTLLPGTPLAKGIPDEDVPFPPIVGHQASGSWEIVSVAPIEGGIPVARDAAGNVLGVLGQFGAGRTAVLGFGPERDKYFVKRALGPLMLDNLLGWLLQSKTATGRPAWPGVVEVCLPAQAEVLAVYLDGKQLANPQVRDFGSLKQVKVKEVPMGFADYGGTVYRLTPVLNNLTIPMVLRDSEGEYPYVATHDVGRGRCIVFSPLMGVFAEQYKTGPAQTIMRNLIRWRKAEWQKAK